LKEFTIFMCKNYSCDNLQFCSYKKLQLCESLRGLQFNLEKIANLVINNYYEFILFNFLYCVEIIFIFALMTFLFTYCVKIFSDWFSTI
jgi:hypothetical protein